MTGNVAAPPVKVPTDAADVAVATVAGVVVAGCSVTAGGVSVLGGGKAGAVKVLVDVLWPEGGATPAGGDTPGGGEVAVPLATGSIAAAA